MTEMAALIAELDGLLDGTDIASLRLDTTAGTITLRRNPSGRAAALSPSSSLAIAAPCPGVVLFRHPQRPAPLVTAGQAVLAGETVALLRAGPLLVSVTAPHAGTVTMLAAAEGQLVGYGTVLLLLERNE